MSNILDRFVSKCQLAALYRGLQGEEREAFREIKAGLEITIMTMPKTYEQDGKGKDAIAYLHYFKGNMNWYITERDMEEEQLQAFGMADLGMGYPELGYISIEEIIGCGVELDFYWTPKALKEINE